MRTTTALSLRVASVILLFWLVLQGPDYLLLGVLDVHRWLPVGLAGGLLTLPLLVWFGVGFLPPWTMPALVGDASVTRAAVYHLCCSVLAAWLWTHPTQVVVAHVHASRGLPAEPGGVPADVVSVAAGLLVAELLFFVPALVAFVRVSTFGTDRDLRAIRTREVLRPGLAGIGSYLVAVFVVCVLWVAVAPRGVTGL